MHQKLLRSENGFLTELFKKIPPTWTHSATRCVLAVAEHEVQIQLAKDDDPRHCPLLSSLTLSALSSSFLASASTLPLRRRSAGLRLLLSPSLAGDLSFLAEGLAAWFSDWPRCSSACAVSLLGSLSRLGLRLGDLLVLRRRRGDLLPLRLRRLDRLRLRLRGLESLRCRRRRDRLRVLLRDR